MTTDSMNFSVNHLAQTHEVFNQSRPLVDYNAYQHDTALGEAVQRHGAGWAQESLLQHGARTAAPGSSSGVFWPTSTSRSSSPTTARATGWTGCATTTPITS